MRKFIFLQGMLSGFLNIQEESRFFSLKTCKTAPKNDCKRIDNQFRG